jgi:hypothetical protein
VSPIRPVLDHLSNRVRQLTERAGRRVEVVDLKLTDRRGQLDLDPPGGRISCNRACRMVRAADGWVAVNLARPEDHELIPAWLGAEVGNDPWPVVEAQAQGRACADLIERAALLGLPVGRLGETAGATLAPPVLRLGEPVPRDRPPRVIDLSALWAGPMCGAILAAMGATVSKVESASRPDPTRTHMPEFDRRLNGRKMHLSFDLKSAEGRTRLRELVQGADVLITGARPRAFEGLGLEPAAVFAANPGLVWVAVTGYGWTGEAAARVAFGDDAAAAGGLVSWTDGEPRFLGDALADPLTGLAAAVAALEGLAGGGGVLVDVALARSAAGASAHLGLAT